MTREEALAAARALIPTQAVAESRGADCYRAGVSIDELATGLHDLARSSGSERVWAWLTNGYYDAKEQDTTDRSKPKETA